MATTMVRIAGLLTLGYASAALDWISHPLEAGDWAMLSGDLRGASRKTVTLTSRKNASLTFQVPSVDASDSALKFQMPDAAALADGGLVYDVRVDGANGSIAVNAPEVWWWQGDAGNVSSPGGWVRVFGRSLGPREPDVDAQKALEAAVAAGDLDAARELLAAAAEEKAARGAAAPVLRLTSAAGSFNVTANESNPYHAWFNLPASVAPGDYAAEITADGSAFSPLTMFESEAAPFRSGVAVRAPAPWDETIFQVDCDWDKPIFDRPCGWVGARSTAQLNKALAAAKAHGGGVVLLPRGQYYVDGPVVVPAGVRLRGAGRELVSLYFREAPKPGDAPTPGYVYSDGGPGHRWAVEDLSLYVTGYYHAVVYVAPTCDGFTLQRTRVRAAAYAMLEQPCKGTSSRGRTANFDVSDLGDVLYLAGNRNYDVLDNDLLGTYIIIHTGAGLMARYGRVARNEIWNGNAAHWFDDIREVIFEQNTIRPAGTSASMGNNIDNYSGRYCQHVYHARNDFQSVWANDREVMTFDAVFGSYMGPVLSSDAAGTTLALAAANGTSGGTGNLGGAVTVLAGAGAGQVRRVVAAPDGAHVTVDRPFATPLDGTSRVQVGAFKGQIIFHRNAYADSGSFQTYGAAQDVVVSEHTFERVESLNSWGRSYGGNAYAPNTHVELVRNVFVEGNHLWNYNGSHPASCGGDDFRELLTGETMRNRHRRAW